MKSVLELEHNNNRGRFIADFWSPNTRTMYTLAAREHD